MIGGSGMVAIAVYITVGTKGITGITWPQQQKQSGSKPSEPGFEESSGQDWGRRGSVASKQVAAVNSRNSAINRIAEVHHTPTMISQTI
jgi:hypothetical protein